MRIKRTIPPWQWTIYLRVHDSPSLAMKNHPLRLVSSQNSLKCCFRFSISRIPWTFSIFFSFWIFFSTSHYLSTTEENWSNQSINQCLFFETTSKIFSHNKFALNLMEWLTWENLTCSRFFNERRSLMEHFKDKCTFLSW